MKLKEELGGITSQTNGYMPPRPGEGLFICRKCGKRFSPYKSSGLFELIRLPFVKCPHCGSFNTSRDPLVVY
jgi:DNA-directed RNA polymerase subunit RPC12/RpoP